jgi:hypothetical protein
MCCLDPPGGSSHVRGCNNKQTKKEYEHCDICTAKSLFAMLFNLAFQVGPYSSGRMECQIYPHSNACRYTPSNGYTSHMPGAELEVKGSMTTKQRACLHDNFSACLSRLLKLFRLEHDDACANMFCRPDAAHARALFVSRWPRSCICR